MSRSGKAFRLYDFSHFVFVIMVLNLPIQPVIAAQGAAQGPSTPSRPQTGHAAAPPRDETPTKAPSETHDEEGQMFLNAIRRFSETYRFGPADVLAIRVKGQPDFSLERVKVSPMGTVYHPLLDDIQVSGLTIEQLKKQLTVDFSEYILDPVVSVELVEVQSAKVAVVGEVLAPRVLLMQGPLTILDAIVQAGGVSDMGSKSNITLLRQNPNGTRTELTVNLKPILEAKARPEENLSLQAGDLVIVHGNTRKKLAKITSIAGFTSLLSLIQLGGTGGTK
ncbi:MAG TPA: polysaccharide biosynthesis/export family protein [Blastocatellia bacterium]|nr:polysaccharide biosynthesis/export family protein [Blastocatellia bacterium]